MMKKRVLMPLLVAGMMMAFVVSLDSCKKNQTSKAVFTDTETPVLEEEIRDGAGYVCPYCGEILHYAEEHWHYFGTPKEGFDINEMMEIDRPGGVPHFWGVADCLDGLSQGACPYSGALHNDPVAIQQVMDAYLIELGITLTPEEANERLEKRFHAHRVYYKAVINGKMENQWHVGGGVPGWPVPDIPQP